MKQLISKVKKEQPEYVTVDHLRLLNVEMERRFEAVYDRMDRHSTEHFHEQELQDAKNSKPVSYADMALIGLYAVIAICYIVFIFKTINKTR